MEMGCLCESKSESDVSFLNDRQILSSDTRDNTSCNSSVAIYLFIHVFIRMLV